jgi:competence protein ComEA
MDSSAIEDLLAKGKHYIIPIILGVAGLVCIGYGVVNLSSQQKPTAPSSFASSEELARKTKERVQPSPKHITIDVEGSVVKPGIYSLPEGSRVQAALAAAGGFAKDADRQQVAKQLNLASPLTDGGKLYIPAVGEQMPAGGESSTGSVAGIATGFINLNTATQSELESLPGIGPVTAQKIIDGRPYQKLEDLTEKKAVGESVFGKIKDLVSVY